MLTAALPTSALFESHAASDDIVASWRRLGARLRSAVGRGGWRTGEHALHVTPSGSGRLSSAACLRRRLEKSELATLLDDTDLSPAQRVQVQTFADVPCWRHIVRLDSRGGADLYAERDYDEPLMRELCHWSGSGDQLVSVVSRLLCSGHFAVGIAAVGWRADGQARLRFHLVAQPGPKHWRAVLETVWRTWRAYRIGTDRDSLMTALISPRRALLVNLEWRQQGLALKLEIPDLGLRMASDACARLGAPSPPTGLATMGIRRLRYLGIRWQHGEPPETTVYVPWKAGQPHDLVYQRCQADPSL